MSLSILIESSAIKYQKSTLTYTPRIKPPAILQVNRESRFEGVKVYRELSLSPRPNTGCYIRLGDLQGDRVYIAVDQDSRGIVTSCQQNQKGWQERYTKNQHICRFCQQRSECPHWESHSIIVARHLLQSPDGPRILKEGLLIDWEMWILVSEYYFSHRYYLPVTFINVTFIHEIVSTMSQGMRVLGFTESTLGSTLFKNRSDHESASKVFKALKLNQEQLDEFYEQYNLLGPILRRRMCSWFFHSGLLLGREALDLGAQIPFQDCWDWPGSDVWC
jgi:hypothetical protein